MLERALWEAYDLQRAEHAKRTSLMLDASRFLANGRADCAQMAVISIRSTKSVLLR